MKTCPNCKATNTPEAKYCGQCMSPLPPPAGKPCPAGRHIMEPDWTECAYCRSESATGSGPMPGPPAAPRGSAPGYVRTPTVVESTGQSQFSSAQPGAVPAAYPEDRPLPPRPAPKPFRPIVPLAPSAARPIAPPPSPPAARKTVFQQQQPAGGPPAPVPTLSQRKIVGILVTYSWKPDGEIFPIREGRNYIGRDPDCEVCVAVDQTMSGKNSHITFRSSFVMGDLVSMKGTDLNGEPIEQQFVSLPNYSAIRAGSTQFTFVAFQAAPPPEPRE